jgi:hypothetical protein
MLDIIAEKAISVLCENQIALRMMSRRKNKGRRITLIRRVVLTVEPLRSSDTAPTTYIRIKRWIKGWYDELDFR